METAQVPKISILFDRNSSSYCGKQVPACMAQYLYINKLLLFFLKCFVDAANY